MSKFATLNRQFISNLKTHQVITDAKRNLILSILKSTTTKREARNYLNKYQNQFDFSDIRFDNVSKELTTREEQRELFINRFLSRQNPFLNIYDEEETKLEKVPLRLAIFKIKHSNISAKEWGGIAETFKRLVHLGISPVILLDYEFAVDGEFKRLESLMIDHGSKIVNHLEKQLQDDIFNELGLTVINSLFITDDKGDLTLNSLEDIIIPLYQGIVPIIQPLVYNKTTCSLDISLPDLLLQNLCMSALEAKDLLSIEKIVLIEPRGGIPSIERDQTSHVFINLSQEYADLVLELYIGYIHPKNRDIHLKNLHTVNTILHQISTVTKNDDTTGIITTPKIMSINSDQLNPIIYNVLTDRPIISSSLPSSNAPHLSTSIIKKGMEVQIFDSQDYPDGFTLERLIDDGHIHRRKFFDLINDSFGRELDEKTYMERINNTIATVVILGDYDGSAIITWENGVAYLDKFAIARKNQGLPSLADIIFKIILQAHPNELIWRSRKNNPVNKWYFERCRGSFSSPESPWKLFYTGEIFDKKINRKQKARKEEVNIFNKLRQYSSICEGIPASFKL
ncbi:Amino-acid acetyltransferase, mitochondrial [Scheffersomyces spartinae]|uniref:Amino-acid acetyltransferase, mitochondrial n=1 Tax=Scheffersomyces spartinae TaxID=45513 RepID=A0A9P7V6H1_9ASCO|nr:Amino-acid acetyltransferase, mitochondrial [Scheffersomyces spartinae]KAG7192061.1 Amino-acid acetyltransferase, mitochondrial [Scheffersomyces spartinae]